MKLPIIPYGNPILRAKCHTVLPDLISTQEFQDLIDNMIETMYAAGGIGLAANQVGRLHNLTVIDTRRVNKPAALIDDGEEVDLDKWLPLILVNLNVSPKGEMVEAGEGCLSIPDFFGPVTRPANCEFTAQNRNGGTIAFEATGLLSRCIQHEFDHLNGVMFMDRFSDDIRGKYAAEIGRRVRKYKDSHAS